MGRLPRIRLHRNGLVVVAGIVLLVAFFGAVETVAFMRTISVIVVIVTVVEIVVHLVRRRELRIQRRLFSSQSTFNPMGHSKPKQ